MENPAHNKVVHFDLVVTVPRLTDLGLGSLGPPGGFCNTSIPHFMKLQCLLCGEETVKDVCLSALEPKEVSCTKQFGERTVRQRCYPTCPNPAHLVRNCQFCEFRGSVELSGVGDVIPAGERVRAMSIACLGYKPVEYSPGPGWKVSTTAGQLLEATYTGGGGFKASDEARRTQMLVAGVVFELVQRSTVHDAAGLVYPDAAAPGL